MATRTFKSGTLKSAGGSTMPLDASFLSTRKSDYEQSFATRVEAIHVKPRAPPPVVEEKAGGWKTKFLGVMADCPRYVDGGLQSQGDGEPLDMTGVPGFPVCALDTSMLDERERVYADAPFPPETPAPPLTKEEKTAAIALQRGQVKGQHAVRKEKDRLIGPPSGTMAKHVTPLDEAKLARMEAEMARNFKEKVAAPMGTAVPARSAEQAAAQVTEFARGNEFFDKGDNLAALAEYELAARYSHLYPYAMINRGNAFKALNYEAEAATCYQQALDVLSTGSEPSRMLHACALSNLATIREDEGRLQQALQYYAAALALEPKCSVASKNRAEMHMRHAEKLRTAGETAAAAPQQEIAFNLYNKYLDIDWQVPTVFMAKEVPVRLEVRVIRNNEVYHCSNNLTHVHGKHL